MHIKHKIVQHFRKNMSVMSYLCMVATFIPNMAFAVGSFDYFWALSGMPKPIINSTVPTETNPQSDITYQIPVGGFPGKVVGSQCTGKILENSTKNMVYWLEYLREGKSDTGLNWSLEMNKVGSNIGPEPSERYGGRPGYMVMVGSFASTKAGAQTCRSIGSEYPTIALPSGGPVTGRLILNKDELFSGVHTIKIPFYNAMEENFITGSQGGTLYLEAAKYTPMSVPTEAVIVLKIETRCNIDIKSHQISHGIVPSNVMRHKAKSPIDSTLSCENGSATVYIEMIGANSIPGQPSNMTKCGEFMCELRFDINQNEDLSIVQDLKLEQGNRLIIRPTSTLHLERGAPAGDFTGSGVIKVLFK